MHTFFQVQPCFGLQMFNACVRLQQNRVPLLQQKHSNVFMYSHFYCKTYTTKSQKKIDWVCKGLWPVWLGRGRRQYQGHTGWWRKRKWGWKCDPSMSPVRLGSTKLKMCHQYRIALKPKMLWSSFYTLYSPSECTTARYFRVGMCLIRHRSLQFRGSPEKTKK